MHCRQSKLHKCEPSSKDAAHEQLPSGNASMPGSQPPQHVCPVQLSRSPAALAAFDCRCQKQLQT